MRFSALHTLEVLHATKSLYTSRRLLTRSSAALLTRDKVALHEPLAPYTLPCSLILTFYVSLAQRKMVTSPLGLILMMLLGW